ncbi:uncharacterized protein [Dermacentor andersoni]|uniref:uncharacterized protein n=1 Tax=Dermacentor andersoni TaxID=34620 RepID=UPI002415BAD2|nr:uncharacterized protein LOC129380332 [Dermacentor andersoni]
MKKKKKVKPKAKKPAEGSKISISTAVAEPLASPSAIQSTVTRHSEAASFTQELVSKAVDKTHEPTQEKQPTEGGRDQLHTTQSHPSATLVAHAGPGGDTGNMVRKTALYWVYVISAFVIVVLTGVAVLMVVLMWRKGIKKSVVGTSTSVRPPVLGLILSA